MAPQQDSKASEAWVLNETEYNIIDFKTKAPSAEKIKLKIVWRNVVLLTVLHLSALYGCYLLLFEDVKWQTVLFGFLLMVCTGLGITAGAHRLWAHKAYKARLPLRALLTIFNTIAFQDSVIDWARDHRMHHKYSETDADPYNATRGLFFSHMGWLMVRKHPQIKAKGHNIDMSDLWADPILRFQKKYYVILMLLGCFILPAVIPTRWGESLWNAYFVCSLLRYTIILHFTWLVNSVAHKYGNKPYDKYIKPTENKAVSFFTFGEGYHNYHHTFPWDYQTAELGSFFNNTKVFIDGMAKFGWAYDLKTVSRDVIEKRVIRTGDGSYNKQKSN